MSRPLVWVHDEALAGDSQAFLGNPGAPAVFVFDEGVMRERQYGLKRLGFVYECLLELPVEIHRGEIATILPARRGELGCDGIVAMRTRDPRLTCIGNAIGVRWIDGPAFVDLLISPDLRRFSRYWQDVKGSAMRPTA